MRLAEEGAVPALAEGGGTPRRGAPGDGGSNSGLTVIRTSM
ncbi:hypothetical protein STRTUCAR8_03781, partial [Streptomyces turgidiscabies Car8]